MVMELKSYGYISYLEITAGDRVMGRDDGWMGLADGGEGRR